LEISVRPMIAFLIPSPAAFSPFSEERRGVLMIVGCD
jgi:hypothetical protein